MIIKKIKEILVRLILNDPGFKINDDSINVESADVEHKITKHAVSVKDSSINKNESTENKTADLKEDSKIDFNCRSDKLRRDLGIFVFILFILYIANNYLVDLHQAKFIEYSISFSEIDAVTSEFVLIVNINTADIDELILLPAIGKNKAEAIIEYRTDNDGFKSIEEIMNVKGIGEKIFEQIKNHITIK